MIPDRAEANSVMIFKPGFGLTASAAALIALLAACAPAQDDPRRQLGYKAPDQLVEPGFSRNEGFRSPQTLRTNRTSNKFGRSRGTIRSRNSRRRIGR